MCTSHCRRSALPPLLLASRLRGAVGARIWPCPRRTSTAHPYSVLVWLKEIARAMAPAMALLLWPPPPAGPGSKVQGWGVRCAQAAAYGRARSGRASVSGGRALRGCVGEAAGESGGELNGLGFAVGAAAIAGALLLPQAPPSQSRADGLGRGRGGKGERVLRMARTSLRQRAEGVVLAPASVGVWLAGAEGLAARERQGSGAEGGWGAGAGVEVALAPCEAPRRS